ncbi:Tol-Pal system beta propeller repeat protein TolB [Candidatus Endobugula sertula]|uniref:Tol-Pal system protein TolB n=1 Tax=Candidatus Endobugula sertula TaxID=62101 RepID=A0A1D2QLY6_9GAMM|nr:Tol-Pal system beta propeller repeat protein TolB [Candidatus Endobugula sertula]
MRVVIVFLLAWLLSSSVAHAELTIRITQGVDNPTVIGIVPFNYTGTIPLPENVSDIISNDLRRSGQFGPIDPSHMLSYPSHQEDVIYRDWRLLGSEYLVIGNIDPKDSGYQLTYSLYDVVSQQIMISNQVVVVESNGLRDMAHHVSDAVYELITGIRGVFSTHIIYVEHQKAVRQYRLMRADMDGARPQVLLKSSEPLLSPTWSPDGQSVAYVSFETSRPAIFVQNLLTGKRQQITNFKGLNGAPAWSPDGRKLALVLSKDGNSEIYTIDLASRRFSRITNHFGIDTEPTWAADGKHIIFTSNRGGKPQIYRANIAGGGVQRLTFEGNYNARAQVAPDGKHIVMVHRRANVFHIASQELGTGQVRVLTETNLDESPSIAPNGALLIYATKVNGKGALASVSMDAGTKFILPSTSGDVREPSWSPYFK